jgi:hypothetical protein
MKYLMENLGKILMRHLRGTWRNAKKVKIKIKIDI